MSEAEVLYTHDSNNFTPEEPWTTRREHNHWYSFQADYALENLGRGPGSLLIIGSPVFEALEFELSGWDVTYLDVRPSPFKKQIQADASTYNFPENSFDAVSSTCVLCHAGMGRYGDESVDRGDLKILAGIYKTLKVGSLASITFGPVSVASDQIRLGNMERIYTLDSAKRAALEAGFKIENYKILDIRKAIWVPEITEEVRRLDRHYLSMTLRKI